MLLLSDSDSLSHVGVDQDAGSGSVGAAARQAGAGEPLGDDNNSLTVTRLTPRARSGSRDRGPHVAPEWTLR